MLLAIDTATHYAGLALYGEGQVWAEENWRSAMTHSVELMPRIRRMLSTQQVAVEALAGIAVSLGPGSFTGLRIGLAAAKGLALPLSPAARRRACARRGRLSLSDSRPEGVGHPRGRAGTDWRRLL